MQTPSKDSGETNSSPSSKTPQPAAHSTDPTHDEFETDDSVVDNWDRAIPAADLPETGLPEIGGDPAEADDHLLGLWEQAKKVLIYQRPETDDELHDYIRVFLGVDIPRVAVCPGHQSSFQAISDLFFMRYPHENLLLIGGRGTGKTLGFALVEHLLMFFDKDTIANVGAVEAQALKCYSYIQRINRDPLFAEHVQSSMLSKTVYKNGGEIEILPGTMARVNSPHPRLACLDEVDLLPWPILQEALSMPIRTNGRPPQTVYTSSLKKRYGPMVKLLEESTERAIRTYTFCVFEVIQTCEPERHQNGEGCFTCPLAKECLDSITHADGTTEYMPGPGKAARAKGFMPVDDVIKQFKSLDKDTWDSQWRCKQPSAKNLVYPTFDPNIHVIDYEWQPNLPVYAGFDFGFTNASVAVYVQQLPTDEFVVFAEDFATLRDAVQFAESVKSEPWFSTTLNRQGDPAAADARATFNRLGIAIAAANNSKDVSRDDSGISKIRWLLAPPGSVRPLLYISRKCVNLIREIKSYHFAELSATADKNSREDPAKVDDHALDALRYIISKLVKHKEPRRD
jgi:hypothetical protein